MLGARSAARAIAIAARSQTAAAFAHSPAPQRSLAAAAAAGRPPFAVCVAGREPLGAAWPQPASACSSSFAVPAPALCAPSRVAGASVRGLATKADAQGGDKEPPSNDEGAAGAAAEDKEEAEEKRAEGEEGEADEDEDDDARYEQGDALPAWQIVLWLAGLGIAGWFGSVTVMELIPTATAPQSIRQRAMAVLEGDPDVVERFGKITRSFGAGYGGERGRRNFVQSYTYTRAGVKHTRIKFMVETDEKRRAAVFAEVSHKAPRDWVYLMLEREGRGGARRRRQSSAVVVLDNRKPEKPLAVRQREVVSRLLSTGAQLYHGGPLDSHGQGQMRRFGPALGESERASLLIDCSREHNEKRCEEAGFAKGVSPLWMIRKDGKLQPRKQKVLELSDLEEALGIAQE